MSFWNPDATHDPARTSWVETAAASPFPLQNLPWGVFRPRGKTPRIGVAIGDRILDVRQVRDWGLLTGAAAEMADRLDGGALNGVMAAGRAAQRATRHRLFELLGADNQEIQGDPTRVGAALHPMAEVEMELPVQIGDYTDFYASVHHATNVGSMFRPDNPLLPNYKWIPVGYHGRASSVVVSGTEVTRPRGQTKADEADAPEVTPSRLLDYELEVGVFVGAGNALGSPIPLAEAEAHLFGLCLVNDWSARDLQKWEYVPLGPFLAKSFATSISPWVVTLDALAPFRCPVDPRPAGDPAPLPYLSDEADRAHGGIDLTLEVHLATAEMRARGDAPHRLSRGSFRGMYWTFGQMLTHHTSNGCNLRPGDLLASGTVSGPQKENRGSLLELSWRGTEPVRLPHGEERRFLQDGDEVILRGVARREGRVEIGLGECRGVVRPAAA